MTDHKENIKELVKALVTGEDTTEAWQNFITPKMQDVMGVQPQEQVSDIDDDNE